MAHFDDIETQAANKSFIRLAMREPMLEKNEEIQLATAWLEQNDERALEKIIRSHNRLVIAIAMKFRNYGLPVGDLIQEGNIGLLQAANKFDVTKDVRFSTYASWWIRAQVQDHVLRNWSIVRTGSTAAQKSLFFNFRRLKSKLREIDNGGHLIDDEIASIAVELNVPERDVRIMEKRMSKGDQSLNMQLGDSSNETEIQDLMPSQDLNPEDIAILNRDSETRSLWLNKSIGALDDREQEIIRTRHLGEDVVTLETLGKSLGISKERVRQIEKRAMDKLRDSIEDGMGHA